MHRTGGHLAATTGAVLASLMLLVVIGCGKDTTMEPTITLAEAQNRVGAIVGEAAAQLPAGAQIQPAKGRTTDPIECEGAGGVGFSGQVFVEHWYEIVHPASWPTDQVIDVLDRYWKSRGYRLDRDDRSDPTTPELYVSDRSRAIGIGVTLYRRSGGTVDAYLVGSSDCVWEHGTPPPHS